MKIADLKVFLDRNIVMMRNNWEDKRHFGVQISAGESVSHAKEVENSDCLKT